MSKEKLSPEKQSVLEIEERFEEAVHTLRRLRVSHTHPMAYFNTWPDIVYTEWEVMMQDKLPLRLGPPSPQAISRMEETFDWLYWLEIEERHLIWWRAKGIYWKLICRNLGCSRTTAWRRWITAIYKIHYQLERTVSKG